MFEEQLPFGEVATPGVSAGTQQSEVLPDGPGLLPVPEPGPAIVAGAPLAALMARREE